MKSRGWKAMTIVFAVFAAACGSKAATPTEQEEGPIAVGETAPTFTLESAGGGPVSLSDDAGKPVPLYFSTGPG